jgi:phage-related minor tail protein
MSEVRVRLSIDDSGFAVKVDNAADSLQGLGRSASTAGAVGQTSLRDLAATAASIGPASSRSMREIAESTGAINRSARQTQQAMAQLPLQFQDIVVSLQAGQAPLTVLLQQGSQIAGTFGGAVPALKAMAGYVVGLVNPVTFLGAAAAVAAVGFYKGRQEVSEFTKTLVMSGNPLGLTTDALIDMSKAIDAVGNGATRGQAAAVLNQLAATGDVGAQNLHRFALAAIELQNVGGPAAEETAKAFAALANDPVKAVLKLNESQRFLRASTFEQIQALVEQGRSTEAAKVAQEAYSSAIEQRTPQMLERLGYVERAWKSIKEATREAGDAITGIGVPRTLTEQLAEVEGRLDRIKRASFAGLQAAGPEGVGRNMARASTESDQATADTLRESIRLQNSAAAAAAAIAREEQASIKRSVVRNELQKQYADRNTQMLAELKKARDSFAGLTDAESMKTLNAIESQIRSRFKPPKAPKDTQGDRGADLVVKAQQAALATRIEAEQLDKLSGSQRLALEIQQELTAGKIRLSAAQAQTLAKLVAEIDKNEKKRALDEASAKWVEETARLNDAAQQARERDTEALRRQITAQGEANLALVLSATALSDLESARLDDAAAAADWKAQTLSADFLSPQIADQYREQAAALRELAAARRAGGILKDAKEAREKDTKVVDDFLKRDFGGDLSAGFDKASQSLGVFVNSFSKLLEMEDERDKARAAAIGDADALAKIDAKAARAQISSYASLAGAAKGFFGEGSRGYKTMAAAEKVFRATELANAVASHSTQLAQIGTRVAAFVTGNSAIAASDTARAGVEQGNSLMTAAVKGAEAVVNAMRSLPFPLNVAAGATTAAAVAALGVRLAGGISGGGGGVQSFNTGAGSVLGDDKAPSRSLENSLSALRSVNTMTMRYSAQMAASLRTIEANIGGVANLLARTGGVAATGAGVSSGLGRPSDIGGGFLYDIGGALGNVPVVGRFLEGLVSKLFGSSQAIRGQGIYAGAQGVNDVLGRGFDASYFANIETTSRFLGVKTGSSTDARFTDADPQFERQVQLIVKSFTETLASAAGPLGTAVDDLQRRLSQSVVNLGAIDLQGLTGEQQREKLTQVFSKLGDDLASAALPGFQEFTKVGEGYLQTVVRVATGTEQAEQALRNLGVRSAGFTSILSKQADDLGAELVRSSVLQQERLLQATNRTIGAGISEIVQTLEGSVQDIAGVYRDLVVARSTMRSLGLGSDVSRDLLSGVGGLDELASALSAFEELVLTDAERFTAAQQRLGERFATFGRALPQTTGEFAALVRGIDTSTEAGRVLQGQLLGLTNAFAELQGMAVEAGEAVVSAADLARKAADERARLEIQYLQAIGNTAELRRRELDALEPSNRALQEHVWLIEAEQAAKQAAARQAEADLQTMGQLSQRLYQAMGWTQALRDQELEGLSQQNADIQRRIWQQEDANAERSERVQLEQRIAQAMGDSNAVRTAELSSVLASNRPLLERIFALEDEAAASQRAAAVSQERQGLERTLMELQGNTAALRAAEIAALDPLNQALQAQIYTLQDAQRAAEEAAQAAERVRQERDGLERQYLSLIGDTAGLRALELASIDPANRALQERIWTLQDEKQAADNLVSAGRGIIEWINELRGMPGSGTSEGLRSSYLSDLAAASSGDEAANSRVVSSAKSLVDSLRQSAANPVELARETSLIATQLAGLPAAQAAARAAQPLGVPASLPAGIGSPSISPVAPGSDQQSLIAELQALRREVEGLRAEQRDRGDAILVAARRTATVLTNVTPSGNQVSITAS